MGKETALTDKVVIRIETIKSKVTVFKNRLRVLGREEDAQVEEALAQLGHIGPGKVAIGEQKRIRLDMTEQDVDGICPAEDGFCCARQETSWFLCHLSDCNVLISLSIITIENIT